MPPPSALTFPGGSAGPAGEAGPQQPPAPLLAPCPRARPAGWMPLHRRYVEEVEASKAQGRRYDLVLYGDSLTEHFRGTQHGKVDQRFADNRRAWAEVVEAEHEAAVYSIGGDMSHNLLWRLRHGSGPAGLSARVVAALIGSNDIAQLCGVYEGDADRDPRPGRRGPDPLQEPEAAALTVFCRVAAVLEELAVQAPDAQLVVLGLPPLQPDWARCSQEEQQRIQGVADRVNALLQGYAEMQQGPLPQHPAEGMPAAAAAAEEGRGGRRQVLYVDCTAPFLRPGSSWQLDRALIPDGIHPGKKRGSGQRGGGWVLAECMRRALREAEQLRSGG